ncbi:MAG: hypothetical protein GYA24_19015 [Candidatus Lokiarchaeota archaeon]|nr:hypothetical protein [Candidatus Lokiarchaeota archaeon]
MALGAPGVSSVTVSTAPRAIPRLTGPNVEVAHDMDLDGCAEITTRTFSYTRVEAAEESSVEQRVTGTETRVDFNQDGIPEYSISETAARTSMPHATRWMVNWSQPDPVIAGSWVSHAWEYPDKEPSRAVTETMDYNQDGFSDYIVTHADEWRDPVLDVDRDETDEAADHVSNTYDEALTRTYETHYHVRRWLASDPMLGTIVETESWTDIDILANRTFVLVDYDGEHLYEDVPCIIFENVRVPVDSRMILPTSQWVDGAGSLYFIDDGSGKYATAIVFSHDSYNQYRNGEHVPVAVGVAIDYDGDHVISTEYRYYNYVPGARPRQWWEKPTNDVGPGFRDAYFPLSWMAPSSSVDFTGMIYDEAYRQYEASLDDPLYWVMFTLNTAANIGIMVLTSYLKQYVGQLATLVGMYLHYVWGQYSRTINEELDKLRSGYKAKGMEMVRDDLEQAWGIADLLSPTGLGRMLRVYPYSYTEVIAAGSAIPRDEDPVQNERDVFGVPIEVPVFRPIFPITLPGEDEDADFGRATSTEMHGWHDIFRGNGSVSTEVFLRSPGSELFGQLTFTSFDIVSGDGTYGYGEDYLFSVDYTFVLNDVGKAFAKLPLGAISVFIEFSGQTLVVPVSILLSTPGDGPHSGTFTLSGTITKRDGTFTVDTSTAFPRFYYTDSTVMGRAESQLRKVSRGRLTTIVPVVNSHGQYSLVAIAGASGAPNFYRKAATETRAARDSSGKITAHDWQLGTNELMYQLDYGITALVSHYSNAMSAASQSGLFSIFQGGDWRIWITDIAIQALDVIIVTLVSKGAMKGAGIAEQGSGWGDKVTAELQDTTGKVVERAITWSLSRALKAGFEDVMEEVGEEIIWEQLTSELLEIAGVPSEIANTIGEYLNFATMVERLNAKPTSAPSTQRRAVNSLSAAIMSNLAITSKAEAAMLQDDTSLSLLGFATRIANGEAVTQAEISQQMNRNSERISQLQRIASQASRIALALRSGESRRIDKAFRDAGTVIGKSVITQYAHLGRQRPNSLVARAVIHATTTFMRAAMLAAQASGRVTPLRIESAVRDPALASALGIPAGRYQYIESVVDRWGRLWTWDHARGALVSADGAATLEFVSNEVIQLIATARQITMVDPKEAQPGIAVGEEDTLDLSVLKQRDVDGKDINKAKMIEKVKDGLSRAGGAPAPIDTYGVPDRAKDSLIDAFLDRGYHSQIRNPDSYSATQDRHISAELGASQQERGRSQAASDRQVLGDAIEIYQLCAMLRTALQKANRPSGITQQVDDLLAETAPDIKMEQGYTAVSIFSFKEIDAVSPALTSDLTLWMLAVLGTGRAKSLAGVKDALRAALQKLERGETEKIFTNAQAYSIKSFFFMAASVSTGLFEALAWIYYNEHNDDGSVYARTNSLASGQESEEIAKSQFKKPDLMKLKNILMNINGVPTLQMKLRRIIDMTAMSITSRGYWDGNSDHVVDGAKWYAGKIMRYMCALARESFFNGQEGVTVGGNLEPQVLFNALNGNLGRTLQMSDEQAIRIRGTSGLEFSGPSQSVLANRHFTTYATFLTDLSSDEAAGLKAFLKATKSKVGTAFTGSITLSYTGKSGEAITGQFDPATYGASWSSPAAVIAQKVEQFLQEQRLLGMHGAGAYVNTANGQEFAAITNFDPAVIARLTDLFAVVTTDEDKALFAMMPTRILVQGASIQQILDGSYTMSDSTTFTTQENRAMLNEFLTDTGESQHVLSTGLYRAVSQWMSNYLSLLGIQADAIGDRVTTEDLAIRLDEAIGGTDDGRYTFITGAADIDAVGCDGIVASKMNGCPVLSSLGDVEVRFNVDPQLAVGVKVRSGDARVPIEYQGYHRFVYNGPKANPTHSEEFASIIAQVTAWLEDMTLLVSHSSTPSVDTRRPANSYFANALAVLEATRGSEFQREGDPTWNGDEQTVNYLYHGKYHLQAVVNWQTGSTTISSNGIIWESGIGISPDPLLRGSRVRNDLLSDDTSTSTGDFAFKIVPYGYRDGVPIDPTDNTGDLHKETSGTVFWLDAISGSVGTSEASWNHFATFRITVSNNPGSTIKVEEVHFDGTGWVVDRWCDINRQDFSTMLRTTGNLVTLASESGLTIHDTSPSGKTKLFQNFDLKENNDVIAIINHPASSFQIKNLVVKVVDGVGVTHTKVLDFSAFTIDGKTFEYGYRTAEGAMSALVETRALFKKMKDEGCWLDPSTIDLVPVKRTDGEQNPTTVGVRYFHLTGVIKFRADLQVSTDSDIYLWFEPGANDFTVKVGSLDVFACQSIRGGFGRFISIIKEFRSRYRASGDLHLTAGASMKLMASISATEVDFGQGVNLAEGIVANVQLDVSETSHINDIEISVIGLSGTFNAKPLVLRSWPTTIEHLRMTIRVINEIIESGVPILGIGFATSDTDLSYGRDRIGFFVFFESGAKIAFTLDEAGNIIFDNKAGTQGAFQHDRKILPTSSQLNTEGLRKGLRKFFTSYKDGNTRAVRFDEWLIHHLLGIDYYVGSTHPDVSHPMYVPGKGTVPQSYWDTLADAMAVIGVTVATADDVAAGRASFVNEPLATPQNNAKILRWFLLYAAQAGNLESIDGVSSSLQIWVAALVPSGGTLYGYTREQIAAFNREEFVEFLKLRLANNENSEVFGWLVGYGFDEGAGGGFLPLS